MDPFESAIAALLPVVGQYRLDRLALTRRAYYGTNSTRIRGGILNVLYSITSITNFDYYCHVQELFVHPFILAAVDAEQPLTLFHFSAMYSGQLDGLSTLISLISDLLQFFRDRARTSQAIQGLFAFGRDPLIASVRPGQMNQMCGLLVAHVSRYYLSCRNAELAMRPYVPPTCSIIPTGGDIHAGASPLIFSYLGHNKVWKPRCLDAERQLHSVLTVFNAALTAPYQLPLLASELFPQPPFWHSGWIEFADHTETMTHAQASGYARKLGVLMYFAKALGCADLHYENIMATLDGPCLIDAECCLLNRIICAPAPLATSMDMLLGATAQYSNSDFMVGANHFCNIYKTAYRAEIDNGFTTAAQAFSPLVATSSFAALQAAYLAAIGTGIRPRMAPIATETFQTLLCNVVNDSPRARAISVHLLAVDILDYFFQSHIGFPTGAALPAAVLPNLENLLLAAFSVGDTPLFMLEENGGGAFWRLYMDGQPVHTWVAPARNVFSADFTANLTRLAALTTPF